MMLSETKTDAEKNQKNNTMGEKSETGDEACSNVTKINKNVSGFIISKESISCISVENQDEELQGLGVNVYDQAEFENEVLCQVDKAFKAQEEKRRVDDAKKHLVSVEEDIRVVKQHLNHIEKKQSMVSNDSKSFCVKQELSTVKKEQENKLMHLKKLEAKKKALQACVDGTADEINNALTNAEEEDVDEETLFHLKVLTSKETEEERLIRTGEMTPFGTMIANKSNQNKSKISIPENELMEFDRFLLEEAKNHEKQKNQKLVSKHLKSSTSKPSLSSLPSTSSSCSSHFPTFTDMKAVPHKKHKVKLKLGSKYAVGYTKKKNSSRSLVKNYKSDSDISDVEMREECNEEIVDNVDNYSSDDVYIPDGKSSSDEDSFHEQKGHTVKSKNKQKRKHRLSSGDDISNSKPVSKKYKKVVDDGDKEAFAKRIREFEKSELVKKHKKILESENGIVESDDESTEFEEGYRIPNSVWNKLYKYQQTAVRWLWELHQQNCGGIIGDEMGLGKTIQMIAFLVGLHHSNLQMQGSLFRGLGPVILVCPATVMHQWVKEFHTWWPPFQVAVLHESGSFTGKKASLIRAINKNKGILITSYAGIVQHQDSLVDLEWHYIILDEGHKIRNPNAQATLAVKQFRTPHRIILSGSPIQNNLKELWSLFDFIFPGKLGTLPVFMQQFSVPIVLGGYANASQVQVQTAYKCATVLRNTIKPYLLRRMKSDVKMNINLPNKNEQVLFCQLTPEQVNLYKGYINSKEVSSILNARLQVFVGLINLRKICNHPDIFDGGPKILKNTDIDQLTEEDEYGYYKRSGKMIVVEALLKLWKNQGHRVLLFTQSRQMMEILEKFVKSKNYTYMKMDGSTPIASRQPAINKFNSDPAVFVFLLTTRVGGLGVNLTGANRVILYDPDWNPSTDAQARERAWRIGQEKQVTIYRLLMAGTIEEKIYHRQIFKQFVTNRVLKDPRQRRFFKSNDLFELFTYNEVGSEGTETSAIFAGTGSEVKLKDKSENSIKKHNPRDLATIPDKNSKFSNSFSEKKKEQMKELAKKLCKELLKESSKTEKPASNSGLKNETAFTEAESKLSPESSKKGFKNRQSSFVSSKKNEIKRKRKSQRVDGEKIKFVVKKTVYKPTETESEKNSKQDDYVLSKLFKKTGIHTALKHDTIVESSDPDYMIVEGEANRVAKEAIKALKESRRFCARAEAGVPTWTGQHGQLKPRFGQKKKLCAIPAPSTSSKTSEERTFDGKKTSSDSPLSSNDLLSAITKRKVVFGTDTNSDDELQPNNSKTEYDDLLSEIRSFIAFRATVDGQASTSEIIEAFKDQLPTHKSAVFKALLNKICDFSRSSNGEGIWYLKSEFR